MKATRRNDVRALAIWFAFAAAAGVCLLARLARRRTQNAPDYARRADYEAGRTLYAEGLKAQLDAARVFVLLVPAIAAVTITFLADVFDPSSLDLPVLLYFGWGALGVSWLAALSGVHFGRQVVYAVGQHLVLQHFDAKVSASQLKRSKQQSWRAARSMDAMYVSVFVGLGLVACFVGVNMGNVKP